MMPYDNADDTDSNSSRTTRSRSRESLAELDQEVYEDEEMGLSGSDGTAVDDGTEATLGGDLDLTFGGSISEPDKKRMDDAAAGGRLFDFFDDGGGDEEDDRPPGFLGRR